MAQSVLFHPFNGEPPGSDVVLTELHSVFARAEASHRNCCCLVRDDEADLACPALAGPAHIQAVYSTSHGEASNAVAIRQLLPRALETLFFEDDIYPNLAAQAFSAEVWSWSDAEQAALRDLLCRVAVNWFSGNEPKPLELSPEMRHYPSGRIFDQRQPAMSSRIIEALLLMRIRPEDVMDWLVVTGGRRAIDWALRAIEGFTIVDRTDDEDWWDLPFRAQQVIEVKVALDRLANHALFGALTPDRLLGWWQHCLVEAPDLATRIEQLEVDFAVHDRQISRGQRMADTAVIDNFPTCGISLRSLMADIAQG